MLKAHIFQTYTSLQVILCKMGLTFRFLVFLRLWDILTFWVDCADLKSVHVKKII